MTGLGEGELVACLDIDGVVADTRHRAHLVRRDEPDWPGFFARMDEDVPLPMGMVVARSLAEVMPVVWMTGRPEAYRSTTEEWLERHSLPRGWAMLMRPNDARVGAGRLKVAQARWLIDEKGALPSVILDDSGPVVSALVEAHLPGVLVTWHGEHVEARRG